MAKSFVLRRQEISVQNFQMMLCNVGRILRRTTISVKNNCTRFYVATKVSGDSHGAFGRCFSLPESLSLKLRCTYIMASTWELKDVKHYPKLKENIETDVAVVGGGLSGLWCAYLLALSGKKVVILEKERLGGGETTYTTALITYAVDTPLRNLAEMFGKRSAGLVYQSGLIAIRLIEEVIKKEKIECDFSKYSLFVYARTDKEYRTLGEEFGLARTLGFNMRLVQEMKMPLVNHGALEIRNQAMYHPMKFFYGLASALESLGVEIYEKTEVSHIVGTSPVKVITMGGQIIEAGDVIVASYDPFNNPKATHFKKGMYTSSVLELSVEGGAPPEGMYLDMANPYHYTRIDETEEGIRMIVGGEDHRSEIKIPKAKSFKALREYVRDTFPKLKYKEIKKWRGAILEPSDGLALIGETSPHQYVATAFSGNGMTYAPIAGMLITDLIVGRKNPYEKLYDPRRKMGWKALLYKARDYTGEFFGAAAKNLFK